MTNQHPIIPYLPKEYNRITFQLIFHEHPQIATQLFIKASISRTHFSFLKRFITACEKSITQAYATYLLPLSDAERFTRREQYFALESFQYAQQKLKKFEEDASLQQLTIPISYLQFYVLFSYLDAYIGDELDISLSESDYETAKKIYVFLLSHIHKRFTFTHEDSNEYMEMLDLMVNNYIDWHVENETVPDDENLPEKENWIGIASTRNPDSIFIAFVQQIRTNIYYVDVFVDVNGTLHIYDEKISAHSLDEAKENFEKNLKHPDQVTWKRGSSQHELSLKTADYL